MVSVANVPQPSLRSYLLHNDCAPLNDAQSLYGCVICYSHRHSSSYL